MARLKVFRTSIGFHDAYVAAPSRKAALAAWGADKDLFAMGAAEVVTDPALTEAPLASPGEVIRKTRGSLSEHLTAAGRQKPPEAPAKPKPQKAAPVRKARPRPRPSRAELAEAERAMAALQAEQDHEIAELRAREAALRKEREATEARHRHDTEKRQAKLDRARARYEQAMERWRAD